MKHALTAEHEKHNAVGRRDLMASDYYCCHGEDVSRCLVTLRKDGKHTHACLTHNAPQNTKYKSNNDASV